MKAAALPKLNSYIPHTPTNKQAAFLWLPQREAFYGGAAGGGKSDALLMAALQYVEVPGYAALLLRRSYTDLSLPGALMDRAAEWLGGTDAKWSGLAHTWTFPSGATVSFGYLDHDGAEERYKSAEFQLVCFDELTQFSERQYRYLFSRLRRLRGADVPVRMRAASNPDGPGHDWVKQRFIIEGRAANRPFIPAKLTDNPHLDQDAYQKSLAQLDPVTRMQLLNGDWDVRPTGSIAKREWFPIVDAAPAQGQRVRYWDLAATERSAKSADPDYTVGTRMIATPERMFYIEHVLRGRYGPGGLEQVVRQTAMSDTKAVAIRWEQEGGASGKILSGALVKLLPGWDARPDPVSGDKITRAMPFMAQAEAGNVRLVRGPWVSDWLDEIVAVPNGAHDDQWDSAAGAFRALTSAMQYAKPGAAAYA